MGVFVRLIPDSKIIKAAEDFLSVAIVGCSGCANHSIAHEKDQPLSKIITDETTGKPKRLAYAIREQTDRLKKLLEDKGANVITEIILGPCVYIDDDEYANPRKNSIWRKRLKERCANVEALIPLCCSGGVFGLKQLLEENIKIIPGMRDAGTFQTFSVLDEKREFVIIDRDRSTVIQFK